jgi:hypothetical protein
MEIRLQLTEGTTSRQERVSAHSKLLLSFSRYAIALILDEDVIAL